MKNSFLLFLILSFSQVSIFAQSISKPTDIGSAVITNNFCVTLNASEELKPTYKIFITAFNFQSEIDARKAFGKISNNYLTYTVDFGNQVVYLKIHSDRTQTLQNVVWWNEYLKTKCK